MKKQQFQNGQLLNVDLEWLHLVLEAKAIGLSVEDVKAFLKKNGEYNTKNR
ncbi:MAG TPA: DNA-binding anti-repressor SinI [Bacillus bacterium]|nr:DNA-binding anti-repressor SinI [Bacillus sp. (in: firmicutes)]